MDPYMYPLIIVENQAIKKKRGTTGMEGVKFVFYNITWNKLNLYFIILHEKTIIIYNNVKITFDEHLFILCKHNTRVK